MPRYSKFLVFIVLVTVAFLGVLFRSFEAGNDIVLKDEISGIIDGRSVRIPANYANFVDFEQVALSAAEQEPKKSTEEKRISSFSFEIPIQCGECKLSGSESLSRRAGNASRLLVTVRANSSFTSDENLNALADSAQQRFGVEFKKNILKDMGLEKYTPYHPGAITNKNVASRMRTLYIGRKDDGSVATYLECRTQSAKRPICVMQFTLSPIVKVSLRVIMPEIELKNWRKHRHVVEEKVNSFFTD